MDECAMLDGLNDDGFQSFDTFEEFEGWSTFSSVQSVEPYGDCFNDWGSFQENLSKDVQSTSLLTEERGPSGQNHKVEDGVSPCLVFHECFHTEEAVKELPMTEIPSLFDLMYNLKKCPQTSALSREAISLFQRLLCEPQSLSLSGPKPSLHSHKQLIGTLQLQHSDKPTSQGRDLADLVEKHESPSTALIQTKLMGPRHLSNSPGFFYQVSHQWLNQCSMRLLPHQGEKNLLQ